MCGAKIHADTKVFGPVLIFLLTSLLHVAQRDMINVQTAVRATLQRKQCNICNSKYLQEKVRLDTIWMWQFVVAVLSV